MNKPRSRRLIFPFTFGKGSFVVFLLCVGLHLRLSLCQQGPPRYKDSSYDSKQGSRYRDSSYENPQQPQGAPNPGDDNYRTYTYNNRRYGQHYIPGSGVGGVYTNRDGSSDDGYRYQSGMPGVPPTAVPLPGVLAGWRPDLQGKQRPDWQTLQLSQTVLVKTSMGQVQGFKVHLYDHPDPASGFRPDQSPVEKIQGEVSTFLGIPYAMPPTQDGRFKPPRAHRGWQLIQAVDFGPACPQPVRYIGITKGVRDMDEDCLYLNVFTPTTKAGRPQMYPVMIYIHGGEFYRGASNLFPAHVMAAFYEVVVVTINYRLGALGFLSTADENSPGNYGVLDQAMALQWVHNNIEYFNGDKKSITLFGPGAGAASAGLLMVAPRTRDLVHRVIAQSGSALADWALIVDHYRAQNTSRVYGELLGCSIETSWKLVNCLKQGRSAIELGNAEFAPQVGFMPWAPVLDGNFTVPEDSWYEGWRESDWHLLHDTPEKLIRSGEYNQGLVYMSGVTTQEAAYVISNNETLAPYYEVDEKFFDQKIHELVLRYNYTLNPDGVYEAIKYMYTYWPDPRNTTMIREKYIDLLSDFLYRAPSDQMAKLLVERGVPAYLYVLNTTVEAFKLPEWRRVPHDTEHTFLTGAPFMDTEFFPKNLRWERRMWTDNDRNMSHFFMKAFTDFARYGNPTHTQILGLHFEMARAGQLKYLNVNTTFNSSVELNYRQTEAAFWTMYLPTVVGHLVPTYPPSTEYWWEPTEPLQIAFWSVSGACLLLVVFLVVCCILWRNAKRQSDRYYSGDILMMREDLADPGEGIDNQNTYEYRDQPSHVKNAKVNYGGGGGAKGSQNFNVANSKSTGNLISQPMVGEIPKSAMIYSSKSTGNLRSSSTPSLRSESASSLRDQAVSSSPMDMGARNVRRHEPKKGRIRTTLGRGGVPQTEV